MENEVYRFETKLSVLVYILSGETLSSRWLDWQYFDMGPGIFMIPRNYFMGIRVQGFDNRQLKLLIDDLEPVSNLRYFHLAENRSITDDGTLQLARLPQLQFLNLSSCDITDAGLAFLPSLPKVTFLDLSYCNRISRGAVKYVRKLPHLHFLDLQGVIKINNADIKKFERRGLEIHRGS